MLLEVARESLGAGIQDEPYFFPISSGTAPLLFPSGNLSPRPPCIAARSSSATRYFPCLGERARNTSQAPAITPTMLAKAKFRDLSKQEGNESQIAVWCAVRSCMRRRTEQLLCGHALWAIFLPILFLSPKFLPFLVRLVPRWTVCLIVVFRLVES